MSKEAVYNLTNPQENIWNIEQYYKETTINNICTHGIIYEEINEEKLKKAINNVIEKNDNFRININLENGIPVQSISEFKPIDLDIEYIKDESELKKIEDKEVNYKFNIINSKLYKFKIVIFENKCGAIILTVNHIIADSWTLGLVIQSILIEYQAIKNSEKIDFVNPSYVDYIKKDEEYKKSERYKKDKEYWNNVFKTIPDIATIPSFVKRDKKISYNAKRECFKINSNIVKDIKLFCDSQKISIFNFLMCIYSIYIGRVSCLNDFVIGTPILNRSNNKEKNTMGMFVNMAPVRITLDNGKRFNEFSHDISLKIMNILRHQKYSYNQILEDIRSKDNSIPNLYNILMSYQITKAYNRDYGNYKTDWIFNNYCTNDFEIHISDINDTGDLIIFYDYLVDKYEIEEIREINSRIMYMIEQVVENENIKINEIEIVAEDEKKKLLFDFNNTKVEYMKDKTISELFEMQVRKTPDSTAVVFEDKEITYKELNEKSNSLAKFLRNNGVNRNDLIGIMLNRSLEMIVAILGVLKAGGAYIPIDPTYPKDRIEYMLKNSNSKFLLMQKHLENKLNFNNKIFIDFDNSDIYSLDSENLEAINKPEDLAYVIFTSGSTGNPKGVMLMHKNIVNFNTGMINKFRFSNKDVFASITTISFDIFVLESIIPLLNGLKVVIANENEQVNADLFNKLCIKNNVNIFQTTPSRMQIFMQDLNSLEFIKRATHILIGGEAFPKKLVEEFSKITKAKIYNMYGPTETAVWSSVKEMKIDSELTIGKPIANTQMYILDNNMKFVPIGVSGELYISGDGVCKGYINNKEQTDKRFLKNPYIQDSIMYKTGDVAQYTKTGEIVYLGRCDFQVKIRGLRIELEEIENEISKFDLINSCVVAKKESEKGYEYLCAYYTSNIDLNYKIVRKKIEEKLPKYMIPKYFLQIDEIPYTPNGKKDRKNLPDIEKQILKKEIIKASNEIEEKVVDILKEILDVQEISIDDSFFEIGGDSLSAIYFCAKIQNEFNVQIHVKDILENQYIKDIADLISNNLNTVESKKITKVEKSESYPASSSQKRIYYATQVAGKDSTIYNISVGVILEGNLDFNKLENCIKILFNRHEILRTYFEIENGELVQKIKDDISYKIDILENQKIEDLEKLYKDFVKPFDLSKAPLFRIKFIKFSENKVALFFDMHHSILDGTSLSIFTEELCKLYNGESLSELQITYKDYAVFENKSLIEGNYKEAEQYWINQFSDDIPVLDIRTNYPRPSVQNFEGKKVYTKIDKETTEKIENLAQELNITPYMIFLSSFYILLEKYSSNDDIVIGTPSIGRDRIETYDLIGSFVNTLALREKIDKEKSYKDFVLQVKDNLLNTYKYQTYPFDELVKKLNIKKDTSRNPLFDVMFVWQNKGYRELDFKDIKSEYYIPDTNISKFDLLLELVPKNEEINISFEYATKLFREDFIKNLANHYLNILNNILENINTKISDISMLSKDEENKILHEFNDTYADYPLEKTVIQLFEEQVRKTPNNIAIEFEDKKITYLEFNKMANKLGRYLRKQGIKKNDLVCIMTKRGIDMMIGIYGILKAGAAYVPIDPNYPDDRKKLIIEDSGSKVILFSNTDIETDIIKIDLNNKEYEKEDDSNLELINEPDDAVYCIYTSGTTGKPKGVVNKHIGLINRVMWMNDKYPIEDEDVILQKTTYCFDVSVWEIVWWSFFGAKLNLLKVGGEKEPDEILKSIEENQITTIHFVPSMLNMMLLHLENEIELENKLKSLKYVFVSGEELKKKQVERFNEIVKKANKDVKLINVYGPTEASIDVTCYECMEQNELIPIGKPISNIKIYILDGIHLCGIGVLGEICIGGVGVARGYLNRDDLNKEKFIKNPFDEGNMYRTGDLGRWLPDGNVEYIGRIDHQVKIRGLRIELDEIENTILKYPNIKNTVVVKQTINNRDFISCYYVSGKRININNLRNYLAGTLPKYMIPSYFTALDDLPYNHNGKINRKALPLPTEIANSDRIEYVKPTTELQKQLVLIWEKVLNTKPIGVKDNFFELGGDSLLAMSLNLELTKITNKITYADIFHYPTIIEQEEKINSNIDKPNFEKIANLSENYLDILEKCNKKEKTIYWKPKGVLLTGATGFMGIHILEEFLRKDNCKIYCIVRNDPGIKASTRLLQKLNYYFGNKYDDLIDKRIFVIPGNITKPYFGIEKNIISDISESIDLVVNSAARVEHYGNYNDFYKTNVVSVKYITEYCKEFHKKLYHISTISVTGMKLDVEYPLHNKRIKVKNIKFDESYLYIGQVLENVYARSKFEAENFILNAVKEGLDAYILRLGHLMPRSYDNVFQENFSNNDVINKMNSFLDIGIIPDYMLNYHLDFTPVDYVAEAIYKLITHPNNINRVFHLYNHKNTSVKKIIEIAKKMKYKIKVLPEEEFKDQIKAILQNEESKEILKNIIYDFDNNLHLNYMNDIRLKSIFTVKYLRKLQFRWDRVSNEYLIKFLELLRRKD